MSGSTQPVAPTWRATEPRYPPHGISYPVQIARPHTVRGHVCMGEGAHARLGLCTSPSVFCHKPLHNCFLLLGTGCYGCRGSQFPSCVCVRVCASGSTLQPVLPSLKLLHDWFLLLGPRLPWQSVSKGCVCVLGVARPTLQPCFPSLKLLRHWFFLGSGCLGSVAVCVGGAGGASPEAPRHPRAFPRPGAHGGVALFSLFSRLGPALS